MTLNYRRLSWALLPGCLFLTACQTDNTPPPTPLSAVAPKELPVKTVWMRNVTGGNQNESLNLGSALQGNTVVAVGYEGRVVALNADHGNTLWDISVPGHISATPGVNDNSVFVGTMDGTLYALDLKTGKSEWHVQMPSIILGAPAATDDVVIVQAHDSSVEAYAADTGKMLWSYDGTAPSLSLYSNSSPLIYNGVAYVGFDNGQLGAFDVYRGVENWQVPIAIPSSPNAINNLVDIDGTPAEDDNIIFATSYHGNVAAVNSPNGELIWQKALSSFEAPAIGNGKIFATTETGKVVAIDESTSQTLWQQSDFLYRFVSPPAVINNEVVVGDLAGYVHFLSMTDGHETARIQVGNKGINSAALVYNSMLIVTGNGGTVAALQPTS